MQTKLRVKGSEEPSMILDIYVEMRDDEVYMVAEAPNDPTRKRMALLSLNSAGKLTKYPVYGVVARALDISDGGCVKSV